MERQADILGTKILSNGRYAADGLHNLMKTLKDEYGSGGVSWFASHPNPEERISYLKQLVDQGGFNRYAYEGVETHLNMRHKMARLITEYKLEQGLEDEDPTQEQDLM
jgi:predicted Zn-dependent protease